MSVLLDKLAKLKEEEQ